MSSATKMLLNYKTDCFRFNLKYDNNWDILSTFFAYPVEIPKIIYTTNIIEGLNRQFRKVSKTKSVFPNDDKGEFSEKELINKLLKEYENNYKNLKAKKSGNFIKIMSINLGFKKDLI